MPQQIGWSVEAKLLYEIKQLTKSLSSRSYIQTFPNFASFPTPGITGTLYVDEATGDIYVWNGTSYVLLSSGITALNGLIAAAQLFATGSTGTDFNISSVGTTHTFNIPTASATNRGLLSSADWTTFNSKIGGTGTTNYVPKFTGAGTLGNSQIFDNGTNVGINTTSIGSGTRFEIRSTNNVTNARGILAINTTNTAAANIGGSISFGGENGQAVTPFPFATIAGRYDGSAWGGYLQFSTTETGSPITERMRITSAGDVGIGTTSPALKLHVEGGMRLRNASGHILEYTNDILYNYGGSGNYWQYINGADYVLANRTATGALTFGTNNTERLRITSGGNVLIGTTTDTGERFQVAGTARVTQSTFLATTSGGLGVGTTTLTANTLIDIVGAPISIPYLIGGNRSGGALGFKFYNSSTSGSTVFIWGEDRGTSATPFYIERQNSASATPNQVNIIQTQSAPVTIHTNNTERMRISSTGVVRVGAVDGGASNSIGSGNFQVASNSFTSQSITSYDGSFSVNGSYLAFLRARGTAAAPADVLSGDMLGSITFEGTNNTAVNNTFRTGASIQAFAQENFTATATGTNLRFLTTPIGSTTLTERMRITSNGDVGIGTTSPASSAGYGNLTINGATGSWLVLNANAINVFSLETQPTGSFISTLTSVPLIFRTSSTERMRITSAGDVGIGTTSPTSLLHVNGIAQFAANSGTLQIAAGTPFFTGANISSGANTFGIGTTGANLIGLFTNNTERLRIFANGRVGVNTTTDAGYQFDVAGSIRNTTDAYFATSSGNVGIGTASPAYKLTVKAATNYNIGIGLLGGVASINALNDAQSAYTQMRIDATNLLINTYSGSKTLLNTSSDAGDYKLQVSGNIYNTGSAVLAATSGNVGIGTTSFGTSATLTLAISTGTAPSTSPADCFQLYSADITAGNAAPHFRTENGAVVKVYQETTGVGAATFVQGSVNAVYEDSTFDGYTLKQIVKALRNQGLLA